MKISKHYCPDSIFGWKYTIEIFGRVFNLFEGHKPVKRTVLKYTARKRVVIDNQVFWLSQLQGKSMAELDAYLNKRLVKLSPEDLQTVFNYANNIINQ